MSTLALANLAQTNDYSWPRVSGRQDAERAAASLRIPAGRNFCGMMTAEDPQLLFSFRLMCDHRAMRIYFSEGSDPMILDSLDGLNTLYDRLVSFLESDDDLLRIDAETEGDAGAYDERLLALEVAKAKGPIMITLSSARVLTVVGGVENLSVYARGFQFCADEEGHHHHPELIRRDDFLMPGTMSLVVEADSKLIEELRSNE